MIYPSRHLTNLSASSRKMSGKGSKRRPTLVPEEVLEANWDRIFGAQQANKVRGLADCIEEMYEKVIEKLDNQENE